MREILLTFAFSLLAYMVVRTILPFIFAALIAGEKDEEKRSGAVKAASNVTSKASFVIALITFIYLLQNGPQ